MDPYEQNIVMVFIRNTTAMTIAKYRSFGLTFV